MFPQAFRHAGRKKGFALDTRSHPAALFVRRKAGELRFATWGEPHTPGGISPNWNSPLGAGRRSEAARPQRSLQLVPTERSDWGQGAPYIEHIELGQTKTPERPYSCGFRGFWGVH